MRPARFVLRMFVWWQDGAYHVLPGGLTRYHPATDDTIVTLQQGGITKDTWVLRAAGADPAPPPPEEDDPEWLDWEPGRFFRKNGPQG